MNLHANASFYTIPEHFLDFYHKLLMFTREGLQCFRSQKIV